METKSKPGLKVLLITYYWPPSGGAGVQRWLKLIKYLKKSDINPIVLTVNEKYASYTDIDRSLEKDIPEDLKVYKTKSWEPIKLYERIVGQNKVPASGFTNVNKDKLSQKFIFALRSHLFIPDPRKGWIKYAFAEAQKIIKKHQIDTVITTSPPHSTQLIGLRLKKKLGINWIADFRDPWTDIYYYGLLGHSIISDKINKGYEKRVIENADKIITVSEGCKALLSQKVKNSEGKFEVIPNGYDPEDFFHRPTESERSEFIITYTGTMSEQYNPKMFFKVIHALQKIHPIRLQIIGKLSSIIHDLLKAFKVDYEYIPPVPHEEINNFQMKADLLLLLIPESKNNKGIVTGKIFEYLASLKPILCIGPKDGDAAHIIAECSAGKTFERDEEEGINRFVTRVLTTNGQCVNPDVQAIAQYSRETQAGRIAELISIS